MLCQYLQETYQWQGHLVVLLLLLQASLFHSFVQYEECGVPGPLASAPFIGGGAVANRQEWPWFAHLQITHSNYTELCGGSLVTDRHVLTAAHCTHHPKTEIQAQKITVMLGKLYADSYKTFDGQGLILSLSPMVIESSILFQWDLDGTILLDLPSLVINECSNVKNSVLPT